MSSDQKRLPGRFSRLRSRVIVSDMESANTPKSVGLIQLFTGNGKGKTTAALGTAIRAVANGWKVAIVSFDKGGEHYSERRMFADRFPEIDCFPTGLDRIDSATGTFRFGVTDEDRREAERGLDIVRDLFVKNEHQLLVLDEINTATGLGMLNEADVLAVLASKPDLMELIMTGRNCPESFTHLADLVSDVNLVKHYFYHGVPAREGLDY